MTAQQLKNSILQMAVQGKLVPQNPDDEPASVLLERIRAEKQKLIKEGKIKKDKKTSEIFRGASRNLPYMYYEQVGKEIRDISDEIPFDIPDSWEWCRLSDLAIKEIKRGKSPVYADSGSVLVFAQKCNVKTGGINISLAKYLADSVISKYPQEEYMQNGDIIVNSTGTGTLGRIGAYSDKDNPDNMPLVPDSHVTIVRVNANLSQYIYNILKWYQLYLEECGEGSTKQKELKPDRIKELFIPIPPLSEQHRIVAKIEELLPYIEKYDKAETQLTKLNATFPEALKKSILQEAVQGKLVPQNPDDEPASVLLERIRAEKQRLIKEGKIKKDKHESVIITRDKIPYEIVDGKERCIADEVPFELPDSWCWTRCSSIGSIIRGSGIKRTETVEHGFPCIRYGEIYTSYNFYFVETKSFIPKELDEKCKHICKGDVVFTLTGENKPDIAKAVAYLGEEPVAAGGDLAYWSYHGMNPLYLMYFLNSPYAIENKVKLATGDIIVHISGDKIGSILLPLPPLAEQKRIVEKIDELMKYCDKL